MCGKDESKYACPKCAVKTCSLRCVNVHKRELECDGVRDKTKFVYTQNFTNFDLLSDYKLLEESSRFVYSKRKNADARFTSFNKELPLVSIGFRVAFPFQHCIVVSTVFFFSTCIGSSALHANVERSCFIYWKTSVDTESTRRDWITSWEKYFGASSGYSWMLVPILSSTRTINATRVRN